MEPLTLGGRVIGARRSRKLTQQQLADKAGLTASAVSQIENDLRSPMLDTAQKIAEALGVSIDYLVKGERAP
jgi:transcriptional regulator with XRE-family HTH domain